MLYLGKEQLSLYVGDIKYILNLPVDKYSDQKNILLSSDNYILQDINGLSLLVKDGEHF